MWVVEVGCVNLLADGVLAFGAYSSQVAQVCASLFVTVATVVGLDESHHGCEHEQRKEVGHGVGAVSGDEHDGDHSADRDNHDQGHDQAHELWRRRLFRHRWPIDGDHAGGFGRYRDVGSVAVNLIVGVGRTDVFSARVFSTCARPRWCLG